MCRMFGFRSAVPTRAHRSLVEAENALSDQSRDHPDGWGIGWVVDDDAYVMKTSNPAHTCHRFQSASARLTSHTFVVHVRKATVGSVDSVNAHPFRCGRWLFAHNGTVHGFDQLRGWMLDQILPGLLPLILGDTDSEHVFFYLLSRLSAAGLDPTGRVPPDASRVAVVVREGLAALDAAATERSVHRPLLNVLLTDGRILLAHRAGMPLFLSTQKRFCADFATCPEPTKVCMADQRPDAPVNHLLVASERIGTGENRWEDVADGATVLLDPDFRLSLLPPRPGWSAPTLPPKEDPC